MRETDDNARLFLRAWGWLVARALPTLVMIPLPALILASCNPPSATGILPTSAGTPISKPPRPPYGVTVTPGYPAITVRWSAVSGAEYFNLYAGAAPGISPENWALQPDGVAILNVTSPYSLRRSYDGRTLYVIVTAEKGGRESVASAPAVDGNQYIFDDFQRSVQAGAGVTETGQRWEASGPGADVYGIKNGAMVSSANIYASIPYNQREFRFGSRFSFTARRRSGSSLVLIAGGGLDGRSLRNMAHLQLLFSRWGFLVRADQIVKYTASAGQAAFSIPFAFSKPSDIVVTVNGSRLRPMTEYAVTEGRGARVVLSTPSRQGDAVAVHAPGPFEHVAGGSYNLRADGTVYQAVMEINGHSATLSLPDGTVHTIADPRIPEITGEDLIWQLTGPGVRNELVFASPVAP